jgi:hypothetical protein
MGKFLEIEGVRLHYFERGLSNRYNAQAERVSKIHE